MNEPQYNDSKIQELRDQLLKNIVSERAERDRLGSGLLKEFVKNGSDENANKLEDFVKTEVFDQMGTNADLSEFYGDNRN